MFFRRQQPKEITFEQRMEELRKAGFTLTSAAGGRITVTRDGCGVVLEDSGGTPRVVGSAGIVMDGGIAKLVKLRRPLSHSLPSSRFPGCM